MSACDNSSADEELWRAAKMLLHFIEMVLSLGQGRHAIIIFEGARFGRGGIIWHTVATTAFMFSFLFKTFPNALNILILTLSIMLVDLVGDGQSNQIM